MAAARKGLPWLARSFSPHSPRGVGTRSASARGGGRAPGGRTKRTRRSDAEPAGVTAGAARSHTATRAAPSRSRCTPGRPGPPCRRRAQARTVQWKDPHVVPPTSSGRHGPQLPVGASGPPVRLRWDRRATPLRPLPHAAATSRRRRSLSQGRRCAPGGGMPARGTRRGLVTRTAAPIAGAPPGKFHFFSEIFLDSENFLR